MSEQGTFSLKVFPMSPNFLSSSLSCFTFRSLYLFSLNFGLPFLNACFFFSFSFFLLWRFAGGGPRSSDVEGLGLLFGIGFV
jgi:hypothetical protein